MRSNLATPDIFDDVFSLVAGLPYADYHLIDNRNIDFKFTIKNHHILKVMENLGIEGDKLSFQDILGLYSKLIEKYNWRAIIYEQRIKLANADFHGLYELLFSHLLALIDEDIVDAKQYLRILNQLHLISSSLYDLLMIIMVSEFYKNDKVKHFLALLAQSIENPDSQDIDDKGYEKRYDLYCAILREYNRNND